LWKYTNFYEKKFKSGENKPETGKKLKGKILENERICELVF